MMKAEKFYKENIEKAKEDIQSLNNKAAQIGALRLAIVLVVGYFMYSAYSKSNVTIAIISGVIGIVVFTAVAILHNGLIRKREKREVFLEINEKGIKRLNGEYREFEDKGIDLIDESHGFCEDLDVFGQNSLFQMINTTRTKSGRKKLGEILSINKLPTKEEVVKKQEAIKELGEKVIWRQKLYVDASFKKKKDEELDELIKWSKEKSKKISTRLIIACIFMALTFLDIFITIIGVLPPSFLILHFMINYLIIKLLTKERNEAIQLFHSIRNSVRAYSNILSLIETEEFKTPYLNELKNKIKTNSKISCCVEMKKLSNLLDWVGDSSANAYYLIINVVAFADVFIVYNLDKWRDRNGSNIEEWLAVMGEFDALSSIANIAFDNEEWTFANILDKKEVKGQSIGHPLIGERSIVNDYKLENPKQITLITGSNMSGKSTFLRTVGLNLVLAYIGAPSCAKEFECGVMKIYTCMRTKDNLEESISSFYAEILRIKLIIEACKRGENVFFILDEIFKGTNSRDRHTGATVLIKQLSRNGAIGMLSTHDLELCDLEETMKEVENYNFREYYEDNKIKFDYKLRSGKSTTQNAVYLMKLAGIDFDI